MDKQNSSKLYHNIISTECLSSDSSFELMEHITDQSSSHHNEVIVVTDQVKPTNEDQSAENGWAEGARCKDRSNSYEPAKSSTKEEKQRHNEEIVINKSTASSATGSWESVPLTFLRSNEIKENCKLFISNERDYCSMGVEANESTTTIPSVLKPCFIDASTLFDEEEPIYTPPLSATHTYKKPIVQTHMDDQNELINHIEDPKNSSVYEIKDQYSIDSGLSYDSSITSSKISK